MIVLTEKQKGILRFIGDYVTEKERAPAYRTIAVRFGFSPKAAFDHVHALERKGMLVLCPGVWRSIRLTDEGQHACGLGPRFGGDTGLWSDEELLQRLAVLACIVSSSLEKQGVMTEPEMFGSITIRGKAYRMYHGDAEILKEIRERMRDGREDEDRDF